MKWVWRVAAFLFVISIPIFLVSANLRFAINDIRLYEYGFTSNHVSENTGISSEDLKSLAEDIVAYFNSDQELLQSDLFNNREILHMKDVKGLVRFDYTVMLASLAYIGVYIAGSIAVRRRSFWPPLARSLIKGSLLTIVLLLALGIWALVGFDQLFLLFHVISFRNDLWQLSWSDNLLRIFQPRFFNHAAIFTAGAAIMEALVIGGIAWGSLTLGRMTKLSAMVSRSARTRRQI